MLTLDVCGLLSVFPRTIHLLSWIHQTSCFDGKDVCSLLSILAQVTSRPIANHQTPCCDAGLSGSLLLSIMHLLSLSGSVCLSADGSLARGDVGLRVLLCMCDSGASVVSSVYTQSTSDTIETSNRFKWHVKDDLFFTPLGFSSMKSELVRRQQKSPRSFPLSLYESLK